VLQQLAALQMEADSIGAALAHDQPDAASNLAGQLRAGVDETIGELRGTIASLRNASMDDGGLTPSLERFARNFRASTGIEVSVRTTGVEELPLPVGILLFECCQEALTNVARHALAGHVEVVAGRSGGTVELSVRDDGRGFDDRPGGDRAGLVLSREKVALSGGLFFVDSHPGHGTTVTVRVPVGATS
jgi:signal transduction histidine kinase